MNVFFESGARTEIWSIEHPTEHDDIMGYAGVWSSNLGRGSSKSVIPFHSAFYRLLSLEEVPENTRQQWMFLLFFPFFFAYSFFFSEILCCYHRGWKCNISPYYPTSKYDFPFS